MDQLCHLPPQIQIESHSSVNLCPVFYLKAYLWHTEPFRKKPEGSCVTSLFLGDNRQHRSVCAKTISSWVRRVICVAKTHMPLGSLLGAAVTAALVASVSLVSMLQAGDWPEFLNQLETIFSPTSLWWIGTKILYSMLCWASVSRCSFGKCQTLIYIESCKSWAVGP